MHDKELFQLYEKLYFHEIEAREKLNSRLQTPLTLIVSLAGALAFLLQNYAHPGFTTTSIAFISLATLGFFALARATYFFKKSWLGTNYEFLPSAAVSEAYRQQLIAHYSSYETSGELSSKEFTNYVMNYYVDYSSKNTDANDKRSLNIHKSNTWIVNSAALALAAFLVFYFSGFDKAKVSKPTEIIVVNPVTFKEK